MRNFSSNKLNIPVNAKAYTENNMYELTMSANLGLESYEYVKNLHINFVFHDEAIHHLARLTRVFVCFMFLY